MPNLHLVRRRANTPRKSVYDKHMRDQDLDPEQYEVLNDDELETYLAEDYSKASSFGYGATEHAGAGAGAAGMMLGTGLAMAGTGIGFLPGMGLMAAAAVAGSFGGSAIQGVAEDVVYDDEQRAELARNRRNAALANPVSNFVGTQAPMLASFKPSLSQIGKLGSGVKSFAGGGRLLADPSVKQAYTQAALGAGIDTAFEGGYQLSKGELDVGRLGAAATIGTLLQKPTFKPKSADALIKRGRDLAASRPKGSRFKPNDPDKIFNIWADPLVHGDTLRAAQTPEYTNMSNEGKFFVGDTGTKVGVVENASTPTPSNLAQAIEFEVTRGAGILDPISVGPAARELGGVGGGAGGTRGAGIGFVPLTVDEVAAAQGVTSDVVRKAYGAGDAAVAQATKNQAEATEALAKAQKNLEAVETGPKVYSRTLYKDVVPKRKLASATAAVNKAQKQLDNANKQLANRDMGDSEKRGITKLFSDANKSTETISDPVTGLPRKVKVIEVPPEASARYLDRNGEPLHDRLDVWEPKGLKVGGEGVKDPVTGELVPDQVFFDPLTNRFHRRIVNKDGVTRTPMVGTVEARKLRQKFQDHLVGVRKRAAEVRREVESQRRLATGSEKALPPLNEKVLEMLQILARNHGFNLTKELTRIYSRGKYMAGVAYYNARNVRVDPRRMTDDTLAHEGFHNWLDDLQYSTNAKDRKLREDFLKLFEDEPEVSSLRSKVDAAEALYAKAKSRAASEASSMFVNKQRAAEALDEADKSFQSYMKLKRQLLEVAEDYRPNVNVPVRLAAVEERAVEGLGLAMVDRLSKRSTDELRRNTAKFKVLLRNARLRWKDRFGKSLTPDELKEYMLIKYEHDAPFLYNDDLVSGFVTHRLGKRPTEGKALSKWNIDKQQLMNDVQAGNPVRLGAVSPISRAGDDPWKDLKFQEEKVRYNSRGEVAATEKEVEEGFSMVKKSLGMPEDAPPPEGSGLGGMLNKVEQDTGQKFQEARGGERPAGDADAMFAVSRDRARHTAETFDRVETSADQFDPERTILSGGVKDRAWYNPMRVLKAVQYTQAETDQLLIRPFAGLQNADITNSTKKMALYARDAQSRLELAANRYTTRFTEPLIMRMKEINVSDADKALLGKFRYLRTLVKRNYRDLDSDFVRDYNTEYLKLKSTVESSRKLSDANKELDTLYAQTRTEHIANGPKVKDGELWRDPKDVPEGYYEPGMLSRSATGILKNKAHTPEGKALQDKIVKFWMKQQVARPGLEAELRDNLAEYIAVISNKENFVKTTGESVDLTTSSRFNALRKVQGLLMPPDVVDPDPFMRAGRYVGRFAKDMAWYTQIEDDHVMRAIRDLKDQEGNYTHRPSKAETETKTPTLKEIFGDDVDTGYGSRAEKTFRNLDETHAGFHTDFDVRILSANRMITSWWLGALSGVRDTVNSFKNANIYMRTEDWPLVLKSLKNFSAAWKESHLAGANRDKISSIEHAHDSSDRLADSMATVANFSQKASGRELFEKGTRAIQFNLGKLLMRSYVNSVSDSPHIKRVLSTMGRVADVDTSKLRKNPESLTEGDLQKLATAWVEVNQGTYGVRGVPSAMIRGKSSYFLSLSRWSVEKFNRYLKDVIMPMKTEGDYKPFLKATLGSFVEATVLNELANMINAKESYEPSTAELLEADADYEEYIYHAMHMANLSGYFGLLSGLGNDLARGFRTKKGGVEDVSAVTFPAMEALFMKHGVFQTLTSYFFSGEKTNPKVVMRVVEDIMTGLNQSLRITRNQLLASSATAKSVDSALGTTYFKGRAEEVAHKKMERNLKVFNRLHRGEHTAGWFGNLDRYEKLPAANFRYSTTRDDMNENVRPFLESAWKRSLVKGKPDPKKFKSLLQQGYRKPQRISPVANDDYSIREARKFADFIGRVRGRDAIRDIIGQEKRDTGLAAARKELVQRSLPGFLAEKGYASQQQAQQQEALEASIRSAMRNNRGILPTR